MTETIEKLIIQAKNYIEADSKERQSNSADFNIFKITGIQSDEVKMCRMLAEIINPSGTNKKAMFFLKSFIEQVLEIKTMGEEELKSAKVYTEHHTKTDRRIDIAIVTNKRFIPIEVKIYAEDQTRQCRDYYDFAVEQEKPEQSKVYYLTIDGHLPQRSGTEGLTEKFESGRFVGYEEIIQISFRQDVYSWLETCLKELKGEALIRANIRQFMCVLGELSGKMSEKLNQDITKMISNNSDDFEAAVAIAENVNRAKEDIILRLFETLENKLKSVSFQYEQIHNKPDYKYNDYEAIKKYYTRVKTYPAINFKYKKVDDKRDIWFRVELDWRLFCGFIIVENEEMPKKMPAMAHEELEQYVNAKYGFRDNYWWFYWEYLLDDKEELSPNFVEANDTFIKLFDEKYFDNFTNECVERILELTKEMKK